MKHFETLLICEVYNTCLALHTFSSMQICMLNQKVDSPNKHLSKFNYSWKTNPFEPRNTQFSTRAITFVALFLMWALKRAMKNKQMQIMTHLPSALTFLKVWNLEKVKKASYCYITSQLRIYNKFISPIITQTKAKPIRLYKLAH